VWPATITGLGLMALRPYLGVRIIGVVAGSAAAAALYVFLFILAVGRRDRRQYTARFWELCGRNRRLVPAA
jgi:hypothetical protein